MFYWMMLFLAILTEVAGTSTMTYISREHPAEAQTIIFTAIGLSYYFLSKALARIPMGITFAIWEGLGMAAITVISWLFLKESLSWGKITGVSLVVTGVILLQYDSMTRKKNRKRTLK